MERMLDISLPRYTEARTRFAMRWKIVVSSCAVLILLIGIYNYAHITGLFGTHRFDPDALVTQVKQLHQLVTVKYGIQDVVGLREAR